MTCTMRVMSACLLSGLLVSCVAEESPQTAVAPGAPLTTCDPMPFLQGVALLNLSKQPVSSTTPNTQYLIQACGKVSSLCLTVSSGGQLTGSSCHDMTFPSPYTPGDTGNTYFQVQTGSTSGALTGVVTPWDSCSGEQPQYALNYTLPGTNGCTSTLRRYTCGYALPGYGCNNGRTHTFVDAFDMASAITKCHAVQSSQYPDFCYVIDSAGTAATDAAQCGSAAGSWRPKNSCCNFKGTLSCPL